MSRRTGDWAVGMAAVTLVVMAAAPAFAGRRVVVVVRENTAPTRVVVRDEVRRVGVAPDRIVTREVVVDRRVDRIVIPGGKTECDLRGEDCRPGECGFALRALGRTIGRTVGRGIGRGVGRGVGRAVGRGVGRAVGREYASAGAGPGAPVSVHDAGRVVAGPPAGAPAATVRAGVLDLRHGLLDLELE